MYEITFKQINEQTIEELRRLSESCPSKSTSFCPGHRFMWRENHPSEFAVDCGYVIIRIKHEDGYRYLFPYPVKAGGSDISGEIPPVDAVLDHLDEHMENTDDRLRFVSLDSSRTAMLCARYTNFKVDSKRLRADYLYRTKDLAAFSGRHYSGQRNHIKHFKEDFPEAVFRRLTPADNEMLEGFFAEFENVFSKTSGEAKEELSNAKEYMLSKYCSDLAFGVELGGRLIAICLGERYGDCIDVQIEKCLPGYNGCYPFVVNEFAKACLGIAAYMNREDDAGDMGLRTSKLQYRPVALLPNHSFTVTSELSNLQISCDEDLATASLQDGTLSITALREADRDDYERLCRDDEHNRLFEYYLTEPMHSAQKPAGYYFEKAKKAFEKKTSLSLALRLNGRFIGEAILFVFDGRGNAKLGWRLLTEYCNRGYGAAAFKLAGDYGLYGIGLSKITAYCHKENAASAAAIAHSMTKTGEDDGFFYFERTV